MPEVIPTYIIARQTDIFNKNKGQSVSCKKLYAEENKAKILRQIELGIMVCPITKSKLIVQNAEFLKTEDGNNVYRFMGGRLPMLIADPKLVDEYAKSSEQMNVEYTIEHLKKQETWFNRFRRNDYRTEASIQSFKEIFNNLDRNAVCISIGGGPSRADTNLLNLNIGPFPNVDIVADAHDLPYANSSVDAIYCEAVFEHLHTPTVAAKEIYRVLKAGRKAYVCTPFLQAYHGYPHHYQNFTLTGQINLFETAGLE